MDLNEIRKIIELMEEHDLSCFNLETDDFKIKLKKGTDLDALEQALSTSVPAVVPSMAPAPASGDDSAAQAPEPENDGHDEITSPMVGTFYRAPSPENDNFVEVGSRVEEDSVVCIIEAMKVMNEIQAEARGIITKILVSNTDAVQFGEPLFRVKPD